MSKAVAAFQYIIENNASKILTSIFLVYNIFQVKAGLEQSPTRPMTIFAILIIIIPPHQMAFGDPNHCQGYDICYDIAYRDGDNAAQNGVSLAYGCVGHSEYTVLDIF